MQTLDVLRRQTIRALTSEQEQGVSGAETVLWEQLALHVSMLVGRDGFNSLYARSLFLSQSQYPWLADDAEALQAPLRFDHLMSMLAAQPQSVAADANRLLLVTLTDILASLIGEPLTAGILKSAWGAGTHMKARKEHNNG